MRTKYQQICLQTDYNILQKTGLLRRIAVSNPFCISDYFVFPIVMAVVVQNVLRKCPGVVP